MLNNVDHVGHILCIHLNLSRVLGTDPDVLDIDHGQKLFYHCRHHFRLHWACFGYVELVSPLLESNKSVFIQMSTKYRQLFQFLFKEGKHPMSLDSCLYMRIPMESLNIKCYVTPFLAAKTRNMFSKIGQSVL